MNPIIYPPCKKCGANHGMGIEDMKTGKITPIDICKECLFENCYPKFDPHLTIEDLNEPI
jgi:hypothetical protein